MLRSVRDAADRDIAQGRGLRGWCFDQGTDRDSGRLLANRLGKQPFIDGADGLFAAREGDRAIEARVKDVVVFGLGLAALEDGAALALVSQARPAGAAAVPVELTYLNESEAITESLPVPCLVSDADVETNRDYVVERVDRSIATGPGLVERIPELFPLLRFGALALQQLAALNGTEPVFRQLLRHLRALDQGARNWAPTAPYSPAGCLPWSPESGTTLGHRKYGPLRDFPAPEGFPPERWSLHTKLTGGAGARLYFRAVRSDQESIVLIGYFGDHLPTVSHPG